MDWLGVEGEAVMVAMLVSCRCVELAIAGIWA